MAALQWVRTLSKTRNVVFQKLCAATAVGTKIDKRHSTNHQYVGKPTNSRYKTAYLRELYDRRIQVGPEKERHPSEYGCWNHDAEIFAFGKRLGEEFNETLLRQAFAQKCLVEKEIQKQEELGLELEIVLQDNVELAKTGYAVASDVVKAYLRYCYPLLFEEAIIDIHNYLLSDEVLLHIAQNLGVRELIQSVTYPPEDSAYVTTLKAVIGALKESQDQKTAELFILDIILPQLIGKDVNEIWKLDNPMGLLCAVLKAQNREEPESRLLWSSAKNTIMPLYHVGIYSDKKLIGKSPGETIPIAEELAAKEALKTLFGMSDNRSPLLLGAKAREIELDYNKLNRSIEEFNYK